MKTIYQTVIAFCLCMATTYAWGQMRVEFNTQTHILSAYDNQTHFSQIKACPDKGICDMTFQYQLKDFTTIPQTHYVPEKIVHYHQVIDRGTLKGFMFDVQRGDGAPYKTCLLTYRTATGVDTNAPSTQCWPYHD